MTPLQRCTNWEILLLVRLAGGPLVHMSGHNNGIFHLSGPMDVMNLSDRLFFVEWCRVSLRRVQADTVH
jgi:hypothetical protein